MKNIALISFCLFFVFLCGCNKISSEVTAVTTGLSFTAEIKYNDYFSEYEVVVEDDGSMNMKVIQPKSVKGMKIGISNGKILVDYNGLSYNTTINEIPQGTITDFLYSVFVDITVNHRKPNCQNNEFFILGATDKYDYKIILGQSGLPIQIIDKSGINVAIKDATVIQLENDKK